jgi:Kef-type K+ transport system membrane component KefB
MSVFTDLLILLILTRVLGEAVVRLGLPASVGEILSGVLIALVALSYSDYVPYASELVNSEVLIYTADIGIFCLMMLSGIDTEVKEIRNHAAESVAVALGGILVPLVAGFVLVWLMLPEFDDRMELSLLSGIVLSMTAVPAVVRVLQDLNLTHTRMGQIIIGAALFDDVVGLFLLAILLSIIDTGGMPEMLDLGLLFAKIGFFFTVTIALGVHVYPRVSRGLNTMQATSLEFSAIAMIGLGYGLFAESLGLHWILGAFMAGLFFDRARVGIRSYSEVKLIFTAITRGMLAPLFFASIGMQFDPNSLVDAPMFLFLILMTAFFSKVIGCGIPAKLLGLPAKDSFSVGVGMSTRGAVGFVVLSIAFSVGIFDDLSQFGPAAANLFSALVLVGVVTTMVAPVVLRQMQKRD